MVWLAETPHALFVVATNISVSVLRVPLTSPTINGPYIWTGTKFWANWANCWRRHPWLKSPVFLLIFHAWFAQKFAPVQNDGWVGTVHLLFFCSCSWFDVALLHACINTCIYTTCGVWCYTQNMCMEECSVLNYGESPMSACFISPMWRVLS